MTNTPIDLPAQRSGRAAPAELIARRGMMDSLPNPFPAEEDVSVTEERFGGVRCLRFRSTRHRRGTMIYLHGGGFRLCAADHYVGFGSFLAASGIDVIAVDYRLAPEHPFPAGLSDALALLEALPAEDRTELVLAGDSAGGGLTAGLTLLALSRGIRPRGVILYSAWLDMTVSQPSYDENAEFDTMFSKEAAQQAAEQYLQGMSPRDPIASPLFSDLSEFPPTLINVGEHEVLRDDSLAFAEALKAAGRQVELLCIPHMPHVAPTRDPNQTGAQEATAATMAFLSRVLG